MAKKNQLTRWTLHEEAILRDNYGKAAVLSELLPGRTEHAINTKAYVLGLRADREPDSGEQLKRQIDAVRKEIASMSVFDPEYREAVSLMNALECKSNSFLLRPHTPPQTHNW